MQLNQLLNQLKLRLPQVTWNFTQNPDFGILTTNIAFVQAKTELKNPKILAEALAKEYNGILEDLGISISTAGAYINLNLQNKLWQQYLISNWKNTELEKNQTKQVLIDYFNPNVGKKMHVGHIRSLNIGESLRRILNLKYETVVSNNHLGDWGIQFGMIIWGLENLEKLDISEQNSTSKSEFYYKLYVKINQLIDAQKLQDQAERNLSKDQGLSQVRLECQQIIKKLESDLIGNTQSKALILHSQIIKDSLVQYAVSEKFLGLQTQNRHYGELRTSFDNFQQQNSEITFGYKSLTQNNNFDIILGESFYIPFTTEFDFWVEAGMATREGQAIYIDLENEKLGRCYLISSEGYSLYHSRDIIARFVWAGIIGSDIMLTCADNRQNHSFHQVFAVLNKILESGFYTKRNFLYFTKEQTETAISKLKTQMAEHVAFGFMTLPEGPMSTRKGKIVSFDELKVELETKARAALEGRELKITDEKVHKIALATLKWEDLKRDRETDIVFEIDKFMSFEGNTGVYQLYTFARLKSILNKNLASETDFVTDPENYFGQLEANINWEKLNSTEQKLVMQTYKLPLVLEQIAINYKPHLLANHLFELATATNSWYSKHSVTSEIDPERKQTLLYLCKQLGDHFEFGLQLLGIEVLPEL